MHSRAQTPSFTKSLLKHHWDGCDGPRASFSERTNHPSQELSWPPVPTTPRTARCHSLLDSVVRAGAPWRHAVPSGGKGRCPPPPPAPPATRRTSHSHSGTGVAPSPSGLPVAGRARMRGARLGLPSEGPRGSQEGGPATQHDRLICEGCLRGGLDPPCRQGCRVGIRDLDL